MYPGDVQIKVLNGVKEFFCAIVSVFKATHGYDRRRIYFVATCPDINSVHTRNHFTLVPDNFRIFKFRRTVSRTGWIRPWVGLVEKVVLDSRQELLNR